MVAKKRKAADSLANLKRQFGKETPATQVRVEEQDMVSGEATPATVSDSADEKAYRSKSERIVRVSVDMPRSSHKYLRDFAYDAETDGMSVMRGLLELLQEDPELAERLRERLAS